MDLHAFWNQHGYWSDLLVHLLVFEDCFGLEWPSDCPGVILGRTLSCMFSIYGSYPNLLGIALHFLYRASNIFCPLGGVYFHFSCIMDTYFHFFYSGFSSGVHFLWSSIYNIADIPEGARKKKEKKKAAETRERRPENRAQSPRMRGSRPRGRRGERGWEASR